MGIGELFEFEKTGQILPENYIPKATKVKCIKPNDFPVRKITGRSEGIYPTYNETYKRRIRLSERDDECSCSG